VQLSNKRKREKVEYVAEEKRMVTCWYRSVLHALFWSDVILIFLMCRGSATNMYD